MHSFKNNLIKFSQLMGKKQKTCTLIAKSQDRIGYLYFNKGQLINAKTDELRGREAFFSILTWDEVKCKTKRGCKEKEKRINAPISQLLIESSAHSVKNNNLDGNSAENEEAEPRIPPDDIDEVSDIEKNRAIMSLEGDGTNIGDHSRNPYQEKQKEEEMLNPNEAQLQRLKEGTMSRIDQLNQVLADLQAISGDIEACAVVSVDGLIMASNLPRGFEEDSVAAMCAVMLSMGERTALELERGTTEQLFVKGDAGYVVTMRAGDDAVLLVMARKEAKLGLVFLDLSRAALKVQHVLA